MAPQERLWCRPRESLSWDPGKEETEFIQHRPLSSERFNGRNKRIRFADPYLALVTLVLAQDAGLADHCFSPRDPPSAHYNPPYFPGSLIIELLKIAQLYCTMLNFKTNKCPGNEQLFMTNYYLYS